MRMLDKFNKVLDAVRGGWMTSIGTFVAAGLVEIGSGLMVFEGPASTHRHTGSRSP